jgi:two-component system, NtrC family, nitrogen regulation sensor histidine kinase NtrY
MRFKRIFRSNFTRTLFVFISMFLLSYSILHGVFWLITVMIPVLAFQFHDFYKSRKQTLDELEQFVEAVRYHDFSKQYDLKDTPKGLLPFRSYINILNEAFKDIGNEKERQNLYLLTILEFIDTGILSYNMETGEILMMNEALKKMLDIPYLRSLDSLAKRNQSLYETVKEIAPGNNVLTSVAKGRTVIKILITATGVRADNINFKLISFQNINEAVEFTETNAWKKLLSVMTHEIMNSVAPISSLAETLKIRVLDLKKDKEEENNILEDLKTGIATIHRRSEGLLKFTESYRNLSRINKAVLCDVRVVEMLKNVQQLLQPGIDNKKISLEVIIRDPMIEIKADSGLIEQALINLIINAVDAVRDIREPKIFIEVRNETGNKVSIIVKDNGTGIEQEAIDKIFVPFFSTKKTGSGIGLNLCKQIMLLHKGTINVESRPGEGSAFSLDFYGI